LDGFPALSKTGLRCLNPDFPAALAEPLVLGAIELTASEAPPEIGVLDGLRVGRFDEHAVVLALDLAQRVTHSREEILVGRKNGAVELELDHGLRLEMAWSVAAASRSPRLENGSALNSPPG
jgi:hypothetical protein